jgi:hypothetical protein
MLPTWGRTGHPGQPQGAAGLQCRKRPLVRPLPRRRYKAKPIIWILGGDQNIRTPAERADHRRHGRRPGRGRRRRAPEDVSPARARHVVIAIARCRRGSTFTCRKARTAPRSRHGLYIEHDRALNPPKPTLDGEPRYEMIPSASTTPTTAGWTAWTISTRARPPIGPCSPARPATLTGTTRLADVEARTALRDQRRHPLDAGDRPSRRLPDGASAQAFRVAAWQTLVPDQSIIRSGPVTGPATIRAGRAADGGSPSSTRRAASRSPWTGASSGPAREGDLVGPALWRGAPHSYRRQPGVSNVHATHVGPGSGLAADPGGRGRRIPAAGSLANLADNAFSFQWLGRAQRGLALTGQGLLGRGVAAAVPVRTGL